MSTLNFPTSPAINELYSFGGKTWIWTGVAWRLNPTGAINNIPIGNVTPSTGAFTTLTANSLSANNISLANLSLSGNLAIAGNVNSNLTVHGNVSGTYFYGNGSQLTGITVSGGSSINNGNSNVTISNPGSNITVGVSGTSVAEFSTAGLSVVGNVTARNLIGNISGNISGNIIAPGANTNVLFNANGIAGASSAFTFDSASNILSVAGNISGTNIQGDGAALTSTLTDKGSDQNDWNTLIQMGVYAVNRTSWSGTNGTPLDSQVFVGLLEVKNSSNLGIVQIYGPGTVDDPDNVKIQWNRNYWNGAWTQWVRMTNDQQQIDGGGF